MLLQACACATELWTSSCRNCFVLKIFVINILTAVHLISPYHTETTPKVQFLPDQRLKGLILRCSLLSPNYFPHGFVETVPVMNDYLFLFQSNSQTHSQQFVNMMHSDSARRCGSFPRPTIRNQDKEHKSSEDLQEEEIKILYYLISC